MKRYKYSRSYTLDRLTVAKGGIYIQYIYTNKCTLYDAHHMFPHATTSTPSFAVSPVEEEEADGYRREAPRGPAVDAAHRTSPTSSKPGRWFPRLER